MSFKVDFARKPNKGTSSQVFWRRDADPETFDRFIALAEQTGVSKPELIRQCVRYALDHMEEQ